MRYDLTLFEQLNQEYEDRPIASRTALAERSRMLSPAGQDLSIEAREERMRFAAETQLKPITDRIDLQGKTVLELGCGHGFLTAAIAGVGWAKHAIGIDVSSYSSWQFHDDPRLRFIEGDLAAGNLLPVQSVDVVISQVVFEHVARPLQMLSALLAVLKDGGTAWLRMNVYTARNASHRYREVYFPWPHLLFEDDIFEEFYRKHHGRAGVRCSWVNRMTVAHYIQAAQMIGFSIPYVHRRVSPIDVPFYLRFEDKLGRYAALDLETDFLTLLLKKEGEHGGIALTALPSVDYLARQQALDEAVSEYAKNEGEQAVNLSNRLQPLVDSRDLATGLAPGSIGNHPLASPLPES